MEKTCDCSANGPRHPGSVEERDVGVDGTEGRFAAVRVVRCGGCNRLWLRYQVEYEGLSRSGRWAEALIDEGTAWRITPEEASAFIDAQDWLVFGGSHWGHAGKRGHGPLAWGP